MHQSVKLSDAIWLLQLVISSPLIHALGDSSQTPTGFEPGSPVWEAAHLPSYPYIYKIMLQISKAVYLQN